MGNALERMRAASGEAQAIGAFLTWCGEQGLHLALWNAQDELCPDRRSIEQILAAYFEIDLAEVEREKRELLDLIRAERGEGAGGPLNRGGGG